MFHTLFRLGFRERNRQRARGSVQLHVASSRAPPLVAESSRKAASSAVSETLPCANARIETARCRRRVVSGADCDAEKGMLGVANRPPERFIAIPRTASLGRRERRAARRSVVPAWRKIRFPAARPPIFRFRLFRQTRATPASGGSLRAAAAPECLLLALALTDTDSVPRAQVARSRPCAPSRRPPRR